MKINKILILLVAFCTAAVTLQAQKVKIVTVDISQLYNEYYKTQEAKDKFEVSVQNAQVQIDKMREEGKTLIDELDKLEAEERNTALSLSKRDSISRQIKEKQEEVRQKKLDLNQFVRDSQQVINESRSSYNTLLLDEIKAIVIEKAKDEKATLVFDTSGRNSNSVPSIYYADSAWDITEDVLKTLNKNAPDKNK